MFTDTTEGIAATSVGQYFKTPSPDPDEAEIIHYRNSVSTSVELVRTPSVRTVHHILSSHGKNLVNKSEIVRGEYYSPAAQKIVQSNAWRRTGFIPVSEGQTYTLSGVAPGMAAYTFPDDDPNLEAISAHTGTFIVPQGATCVVINVTNEGQDVTSYDDTVQLELGEQPTEYEPYSRKIPADLLSGLPELSGLVQDGTLFDTVSLNMIDPEKVDYTNRYSEGSLTIIPDNLGIAASDWIPVEEGHFYALSGAGAYGVGTSTMGLQGGYFTEYGATAAIQNIEDYDPVSGAGRIFQVPTGLGISHVVISLRKLDDEPGATSLHGDVQLEAGEQATPFQPYKPKKQIKPDLIPAADDGGGSVRFDATAWYTYTEGDEGQALSYKLPLFRSHWLAKDKDLVVVNTGTSLTARSAEHCTDHPDASIRPPLMHSRNLASLLWDRMAWEGQQYRRYDAPGFFTETGSVFITTSNLSEWDDNIYRQGWTRCSEDTGAGVTFEVPVHAWQINFIYRTDSVGCPDPVVTVAEGDGQMEVYDEGSATWVEANGFVFTMVEPEPVTREIMVPRASTGEMVARQLSSKGNTTYQKRLKMRCKSGVIDSRSTIKNVTISGQSAGRFMYWGIEWSVREHMITYVNAARGSHNTQADSASGRGLPLYQDNEVWSFKPDLLFFELPIHNDGAAAAGSYPGGYWERLTDHFVFRSDYELSLKTRGEYFGLTPEIGMFTSSISWNFGGIDDDGTLKFGEQDDGTMMTALDKYNQAYSWVQANHPDVVIINSAKRWVDAAIAIFGDLRSATEGSGRGGVTFTNEGSHWNDSGSKIIAKTLTPLLSFTHQQVSYVQLPRPHGYASRRVFRR